MGLADTLKPVMPKTISLSQLYEINSDAAAGISDLSKPPNHNAAQLSTSINEALTDNTISTNPETVLIALESKRTSRCRRAALQNLFSSSTSDRKKHNRT